MTKGRFEHASDCDREVRMAPRPGSDGVGGMQYPGASSGRSAPPHAHGQRGRTGCTPS